MASPELKTFDVYVADGKFLRFLCSVKEKDLASAEKLVRRRVPKEHRDVMVVKERGV